MENKYLSSFNKIKCFFCILLFLLVVGLLACSDSDSGSNSPTTYSVSYIGNGGTPVPSDTQAYTNGQSIIIDSGSGISYSGYTFTGWTNALGDVISGTISCGSANIQLYASWIPATIPTYTLSYAGNGGAPTPGNIIFTNGQKVTINNGSTMTLPGNIFAGWTNASGNLVSGTITGGSANIQLYASWIPATIPTYTLSYTGNGGTPVPSNIIFTNGQQLAINNGSSMTRFDKIFAGWTNASGSLVSGTITGGSANIQLYAKWNAATYTVTYVANGAVSVPIDSNTYTNGQTVIINLGSLTNTDSNLTFTGWTNSAGQTIAGSTTMGTANLNLYAKWSARLVDNGDGTITDTANNLMWFKNGRPLGGSVYWSEMNDYCETNTFAGYTDWRLPKVDEYQTLIDYHFSPININTSIFTNMSTSRYVSITKWYGFDNYRWYVSYYPTSNETLNTNATSTNSKWYFMPVRNIP